MKSALSLFRKDLCHYMKYLLVKVGDLTSPCNPKVSKKEFGQSLRRSKWPERCLSGDPLFQSPRYYSAQLTWAVVDFLELRKLRCRHLLFLHILQMHLWSAVKVRIIIKMGNLKNLLRMTQGLTVTALANYIHMDASHNANSTCTTNVNVARSWSGFKRRRWADSRIWIVIHQKSFPHIGHSHSIASRS